MSRTRLITASAALLLVAACAPTLGPPPPPPPGASGPASANTFRADDFSWSAVPGQGRVDGRLVFKSGQSRYSCEGAGVVLTPETPWTRRRMTILYKSPERSALPADEVRARTPNAPSGDYSAFVKRTVCDANSRFSFSGLANGAWYVITIARPAAKPNGESVALMRRAITRGGRVAVLDL